MVLGDGKFGWVFKEAEGRPGAYYPYETLRYFCVSVHGK